MTLRSGSDANYQLRQPEPEYWERTKGNCDSKKGTTALWPPLSRRMYHQWLGAADYIPQCRCVAVHSPEPLSCAGWDVRRGQAVPVNHSQKFVQVVPLCPAAMDSVKRLYKLWPRYEGRLRAEAIGLFNYYHRRVVALTWIIVNEGVALTDEMISHYMEFGTNWYKAERQRAEKTLKEREQDLEQTLARLKAGQWIAHRRPLSAELAVLIEGALDTGLLTLEQRAAVEANRKPVRA